MNLTGEGASLLPSVEPNPGPLSQGPCLAASPRSLLVLRPGAIGDFILALPALAALRRTFPDSRMAVVGDSRAAPLARLAGCVDAVGSFESSK